jgi:hypothetical protein
MQRLKWIAARDYQTIAHLKMPQRGNDGSSALKEVLFYPHPKTFEPWVLYYLGLRRFRLPAYPISGGRHCDFLRCCRQ